MSRAKQPLSPPPNLNDPNFQRWLWSFYQKSVGEQQISMSQLEMGTGTGNQLLGVSTAGTSFEWKNLVTGTGLTASVVTGSAIVTHNTSGVAAGTFGGAAGVPRFDISALGHIAAGTNFPLVGSAPLAVTTGTDSFTFSHNTSGVVAGTYGKSTAVAQVVVDAYGHLSTATEIPIAISATGVVSGSNVSVDAPIIFSTGDGTAAALRSFALGHGTSGVTAGTYGAARVLTQAIVDARGHLTSMAPISTLGTMASFDIYVLGGEAQGTSTTGTLVTALSTTGVAAGIYGASNIIPQVTVDARGRITTISNAGTLGAFGTYAYATSLVGAGAVLGTTTTGTFTAALSTTGATAGTYGGTLGVPRFDIGADGRITGAASHPIEGASPILVATGGTFALSHNTSGVAAGTYGGPIITAQIVVDERGHITSIENAGTVGTGTFTSTTPFVLVGDVTGSSVTGTMTTVLGTSGVTAGTYGGTLGAARLGIDSKGRITAAATHALQAVAPLTLATGAGTFAWSHNTSGAAAGTYGAGTSIPQLIVDAYGHITSATGVAVTGVDQPYILRLLSLRV